jgi:fatty-acyl-CoA synthase
LSILSAAVTAVDLRLETVVMAVICRASETAVPVLTTSYWAADTSQPGLETTVGGVLRAAATAARDCVAMVGGHPDPDCRKRWTHAELFAEAEQAARALTRRFEPGERVAV